MISVAINGFGRIGRSFLRAYLADKDAQTRIKIVAINVGPAKKEWIAQLFKYDTFMGTWLDKVMYQDGFLQVGSYEFPILDTLDPVDISWDELAVDWIVDATGKFTQRKEAEKHLNSGAKKVLITAFAQQPDVTLVLGVNDQDYDPLIHRVVSLASCSANAFYPIVKVLHEAFGVESFMMNTMHSYTNRQVLMDVESVNLRRSRAAAMNIIPTPLQATDRIREIYHDFPGTVAGQSTRVPIGKVSLMDVAFITENVVKREDVNDAFAKARDGHMKGVLDTSVEQLVSSDYINNPYSVTIDESLTVVAGSLGKVFGWYDNEAGYAHRIKDFLKRLG